MDLDLTKDLDPPKDLYIEVRVVDEIGPFTNRDGVVLNLEKNSTHYLKISDVILYITETFIFLDRGIFEIWLISPD